MMRDIPGDLSQVAMAYVPAPSGDWRLTCAEMVHLRHAVPPPL
jgi:hypothetical protein